MPSATESRWQTLKYLLLSFIMAVGAWYVVVGSAQVEGLVELRLDYRSLPAGLIVREGQVHRAAVRLRASAELLRTLHNRDLTYTVNLSDVRRGTNILPVNIPNMPELRAFDIIEVSPSRLVLEVDSLREKVIPLEVSAKPVPKDAFFHVSQIRLEPSFVTVKGPESQVDDLDHLTVSFDPLQEPTEGTHSLNMTISGPPQVDIAPPTTTLFYTLNLKTRELTLHRDVIIDGSWEDVTTKPAGVDLVVEVPEDRLKDGDYLSGIRAVVRLEDDLDPGDEVVVPVLVMLPVGTRLIHVEPQDVTVSRPPFPFQPGLADAEHSENKAREVPDPDSKDTPQAGSERNTSGDSSDQTGRAEGK